jgi:hypothetical protein
MKNLVIGLVIASNVYALGAFGQEPAVPNSPAAATTQMEPWQSDAHLRHALHRTRGMLKIDGRGVEFRPEKGSLLEWTFLDINTFFLLPHRLVITTYQNRRHHVFGVQRYKFDLEQAVPWQVAASLASGVQRPSQNAVPNPETRGMKTIRVHHRRHTGGTNGILVLRDGGLDYLSTVSHDSRSWRWGDLQTLSEPDPYHLLVFAYRDAYSFDLKEPLSRTLLNSLSDEIVGHQQNETGDGPMKLPSADSKTDDRREQNE